MYPLGIGWRFAFCGCCCSVLNLPPSSCQCSAELHNCDHKDQHLCLHALQLSMENHCIGAEYSGTLGLSAISSAIELLFYSGSDRCHGSDGQKQKGCREPTSPSPTIPPAVGICSSRSNCMDEVMLHLQLSHLSPSPARARRHAGVLCSRQGWTDKITAERMYRRVRDYSASVRLRKCNVWSQKWQP